MFVSLATLVMVCAVQHTASRESKALNLKLDELITRRIRLEDINEGFGALARGEGIRTVVQFD